MIRTANFYVMRANLIVMKARLTVMALLKDDKTSLMKIVRASLNEQLGSKIVMPMASKLSVRTTRMAPIRPRAMVV